MAIEARLQRPVDAASLAVFRIGFGALMLVAVARFFAHGWIAKYYLEPKYFFKYWGFSWVEVLPAPLMYGLFAVMGACAVGVSLGYRYRLSVVGFGLTFAYAHLIDKTNYLNHYYLVLCLCALMALMPLGQHWSLDVQSGRVAARATLPIWMLWSVRAQLGVVYLFGGIAKLKADWLLSYQPLSFWLARKADLPLLGPWLAHESTAQLLSWGGALFDLSIVPLLLIPRTRLLAYGAVLVFHLLTAQLFAIGLFPYIMLVGSLTFLPADYPRRALRRLELVARSVVPPRVRSAGLGGLGGGSTELPLASSVPGQVPRMPRWAWAGLGAYFALQLLVPLRHWLYPGSVCWSEQGFRFAWNVMLMEKAGSVEFRVVEPETGRVFHASPRDYFTPYQTHMMAPQPDMILEAAHVVREQFRARGVRDPAVYADAFASLNGRPMQRLIDPRVDLAREVDGLANKTWILPMNAQQNSPLLARSQK